MRAAAIFGLGSSERNLKPFQKKCDAKWLIGLPASPDDADVILVFGGDGTVHRHLPQLVRLQLPVLVVPCGSGNDFARALNLGRVKDSLVVWQRFCSGGGNVRAIDLGVITPWAPEPRGLNPDDQEGPDRSAEGLHHPDKVPLRQGEDQAPPAAEADSDRGNMTARLKPCPDTNPRSHLLEDAARHPVPGSRHFFCCVGGVGLDGAIARRANKLPRWVRGHGGYVLSLLPELLRFAAFPMKVLAADPSHFERFTVRSDKPTVLAAFANAPAYGGGMKIAPKARFDDGMLDICLVTDLDRFKLFCLFPTVYFGRHLSVPEVEYFKVGRLRLETERPLDVYADGEYVCPTPIEVGVATNALRVLVP
jgi:diacylglycerol kinase family enzyme